MHLKSCVPASSRTASPIAIAKVLFGGFICVMAVSLLQPRRDVPLLNTVQSDSKDWLLVEELAVSINKTSQELEKGSFITSILQTRIRGREGEGHLTTITQEICEKVRTRN